MHRLEIQTIFSGNDATKMNRELPKFENINLALVVNQVAFNLYANDDRNSPKTSAHFNLNGAKWKLAARYPNVRFKLI